MAFNLTPCTSSSTGMKTRASSPAAQPHNAPPGSSAASPQGSDLQQLIAYMKREDESDREQRRRQQAREERKEESQREERRLEREERRQERREAEAAEQAFQTKMLAMLQAHGRTADTAGTGTSGSVRRTPIGEVQDSEPHEDPVSTTQVPRTLNDCLPTAEVAAHEDVASTQDDGPLIPGGLRSSKDGSPTEDVALTQVGSLSPASATQVSPQLQPTSKPKRRRKRRRKTTSSSADVVIATDRVSTTHIRFKKGSNTKSRERHRHRRPDFHRQGSSSNSSGGQPKSGSPKQKRRRIARIVRKRHRMDQASRDYSSLGSSLQARESSERTGQQKARANDTREPKPESLRRSSSLKQLGVLMLKVGFLRVDTESGALFPLIISGSGTNKEDTQ
jgi:hypothetical protein